MSKEDYTIIETAIEYGVSVWGKKDIMAIQIAGFWIDGWLEAKVKRPSEGMFSSPTTFTVTPIYSRTPGAKSVPTFPCLKYSFRKS